MYIINIIIIIKWNIILIGQTRHQVWDDKADLVCCIVTLN